MNCLNRILSVCLMTGAGVAFSYGQTFEVNHIIYQITADHTVRVKGLSEKPVDGRCVIPASVTHDDVSYEVTALADSVFYKSFFDVTSVVLPQSITDIGKCQFFDCCMDSLILPDGIETLHYGSVAQCDYLKYLHLPASLKCMESNAMWHNCSLRTLTLPKQLESVETRAIADANWLKTVVCEGAKTPCPFYSLSKSVRVFVPYDAIDYYSHYSTWNDATLVQSLPGNEVVMNDVHACKGDTVDIFIALNNDNQIEGFSAVLEVPKYCEVARDSEGHCVVEPLGDRWRGTPVVQCWEQQYSDNVYRYWFEVYSENLKPFYVGSGVLCRIRLCVPDDYRLWTTTANRPYFTRLTDISVRYTQGTNTVFVCLPDAESRLYIDDKPTPTSIGVVDVNDGADEVVYNLSGQRLSPLRALDSLPRGVYVVGRKKILVK